MNRIITKRAIRLLLVATGVLIGAVSMSVISAEQADEAVAERPVKLIKMTAENWRWIPDQIRVTAGSRLRLEIASYDASHSFLLKSHGIKELLPEGTTNTIEFDVDEVGTFHWKCGRPCGNGCAKMHGKLIVEEPRPTE